MGSPKQKGSDAHSTGASVCHPMVNRSGGSLDDDAKLGREPLNRPEDLFAAITDTPLYPDLPQFSLDAPAEFADFLLQRIKDEWQ